MKRIFMKTNCIILIVLLALSFSACGKQKDETSTAYSPVENTEPSPTAQLTEKTPAPTVAPENTPIPTVSVQYAGNERAEENPDKGEEEAEKIISSKSGDGPVITKQPTPESIFEGEDAIFIADAESYDYLTWRIYTPDETKSYYPSAAPGLFGQGLYYYGDSSKELAFCNVPYDMDGWYVQCFFTKDGVTSETDRVLLSVTEPPFRILTAAPSYGTFTQPTDVKLRASKNSFIQYTVSCDGVVKDSGYVASGTKIKIGGAYGEMKTVTLEAYVIGVPSEKITCTYSAIY